jgi:hypothetical protein
MRKLTASRIMEISSFEQKKGGKFRKKQNKTKQKQECR